MPQSSQTTDSDDDLEDEAVDSVTGDYLLSLGGASRHRFLVYSAEDCSKHITSGGVVSDPSEASILLQEYLDAAFKLGREYIRVGSVVEVADDSYRPPFTSSSTSSLGSSPSQSALSSSMSQSPPLPPNQPHGAKGRLGLCTVLKVNSVPAVDCRAQTHKYDSPPSDPAPVPSTGHSTGIADEVPLSIETDLEVSGASGRPHVDLLSSPSGSTERDVSIGVQRCTGDAVRAIRDREGTTEDSRGADVEVVTVLGNAKRTILLHNCRQLCITEELALTVLKDHSYNTQAALNSLQERLERQHLAALASGLSKAKDKVLDGEQESWTKRELKLFVGAAKR